MQYYTFLYSFLILLFMNRRVVLAKIDRQVIYAQKDGSSHRNGRRTRYPAAEQCFGALVPEDIGETRAKREDRWGPMPGWCYSIGARHTRLIVVSDAQQRIGDAVSHPSL